MKRRQQMKFKGGIIRRTECFCTGNSLIKNPGSAACGCFIYYTGKTKYNIRSNHTTTLPVRECIIIMKKNILPNVKPISFFIVRNVPGGCERRHDIQTGICLHEGIV